MSAATLISIFGALGVGSLLTQAVAGPVTAAVDAPSSCGPQRRRTGQVAPARRRRADPARGDAQLAAAGLVAGIRREPLDFYIVVFRTATWLSAESWEQNPDPEIGGGISSEFGNIARSSAGLLADVARRPRRTQLGWKKRRDEIQARIDAVDNKSVQRLYHQAVERLRRRGGPAWR